MAARLRRVLTRVVINNFRALKSVDLSLSPLTVEGAGELARTSRLAPGELVPDDALGPEGGQRQSASLKRAVQRLGGLFEAFRAGA